MLKLVAFGALAAPVLAKEAKDTSVSTVISGLVAALVLSAVFYVLFFALRPRFNNIYQPRTYLSRPAFRNTEPLSSSYFGWLGQFIRMPDSEILRGNGLDAYMFISYLNMMLWIFVPIWVLSWIVLLPLYGARLPGQGGTEDSPESYQGFNRFTFSHILALRDEKVLNLDPKYAQQQDRMSGVLIINYIFVAWILLNLYWRVKHFVQLRKEFLLSPRHATSEQAKTILITGVPDEFLSETKMRELFSSVPNGVDRVWINRDVKKFPKKVAQRDKLTDKLEGAVNKLIRAADKNVRKGKAEPAIVEPGEIPALDIANRYVPEKKRPSHRLGKIPCCGEKVDTITYCREEVSRLNGEIDTTRQDINDNYTEYPPQSSAFVLFHTQQDAYFATSSKEFYTGMPQAKRFNEVHPDDIVWENMSLNPNERKVRSILFWVVTWATIIFWIIPIGIIGIISNVDFLSAKVPFLHWIDQIPNVCQGIIKAILPTALLALLIMLLPPWLRFNAKQSGIPTRTGIELSLMTRFFLFQLLQNFLFLTVVSGSVSKGLQFAKQLTNPPEFVKTIAQGIPTANTFFLCVVALAGLSGIAMGFMQPVPLIMSYVKIKLLGSTPRKLWHVRNDMGAPMFGVLFPSTLLIIVIALGYMVLAPIINGWASVSIFFMYLLNRYMFLYVYDCKPVNETSGLFFPLAVHFTLAGVYVAELVVALMYLFNTGTNQTFIAYGILTIVLLALAVAFHVYLHIAFFSKLNDIGQGAAAVEPKEKFYDVPSEVDNAYGSHQQLALPAVPPKNGAPFLTPDQQVTNDKSAIIGTSPPGSNSIIRDGKVVAAYHAVGIDEKTPEPGAAEDNNVINEDTFRHPARKSQQRTLWYPNDKLGIGRSQFAADREAGLSSTVENAFISEKGVVDEDAVNPPGESIPL